MIVAAYRGGWLDLYTKEAKFMRRSSPAARDRDGSVALSSDGAILAAVWFRREISVISQLRERAWGAALWPARRALVAVAANGSRIVVDGSDKHAARLVEGWRRGRRHSLKAGNRLRVAALRPRCFNEWRCNRGCRRRIGRVACHPDGQEAFVRVALAARSVAPLPDSTGFVIGLTDGTVARISRDGTLSKLSFKASELGAVGRIVVAAGWPKLRCCRG
jgi:hypothetical protein